MAIYKTYIKDNLLNLGFKESLKEEWRFYFAFNERKTNTSGIFYLNYNTRISKLEKGKKGHLYWYFNKEYPNWKKAQIVKRFTNWLNKNKVPFCISFFDNHNISNNGNGSCKKCKNIFEHEGYFCDNKCEREYSIEVATRHLLNIAKKISDKLITCVVCNQKNLPRKIQKQHTSYFPENIIEVCKKCHNDIHHTNKYLNLKPPKNDAGKFYGEEEKLKKRSKKMVKKLLKKYRNNLLNFKETHTIDKSHFYTCSRCHSPMQPFPGIYGGWFWSCLNCFFD